MKKLIKKQSETIQEMRDFQENVTLANKERDEQLEEIQKMTETFSKNLDVKSFSPLEEEIENLKQKLENYTKLTDDEEQHLHEKRMFGDYNSFKCDPMNRIDGHTEKDVKLALKAIEAGKECVNFKLVYFREGTNLNLYHVFGIENSSISTLVDNIDQPLGGFLTFSFQIHLTFSKKIKLSALINDTTGGTLAQCRENHGFMIYVFKDVVLTPEANGKGFLYKHSAIYDWQWKHASVTWVIKVLQN
jgi:hypothetical protein